jgi:hypothetical protein
LRPSITSLVCRILRQPHAQMIGLTRADCAHLVGDLFGRFDQCRAIADQLVTAACERL